MLRAGDEPSYLQEVCRIIVDDCGHAMVWIGFAEDGPDKAVRPVAHAGFDSGYLESLRVTWGDTERGRGPTGTAIRTGKPSACRNMLTDPSFAPWRAEAIKRGYASSIVLPLRDAGRAFGAITIYSREPDPFLEDEQRLLEELAADLAHGITTLRGREARERAETMLRDSEARLSSIVESLSEGLIVSDLSGGLLHWNRAALEMHGMSSLAEVRRHLDDFAALYEFSTPAGEVLPPEDWPMRRVLRGERLRDLELRLRRLEDGRTRIYSYGGGLVNDGLGRPSLALLTLADVTESHRAREELRRAHERAAWLARFPQENPEPVLRLGSDLSVTYANQAAITALAPLGLEVGRSAPPSLHEPALRATREARVREELACGDRFFSVSFCAVGTEVNVYGQDVTDLKRARDALLDSERRHRELAQSLQEADQQKNAFLGVLSHELRGPLAPIQNALHVLERAPQGSEAAERAKRVIGRQAGHLARLVDDLLDVTRIAHGKIQLRRGRVEVTELVAKVLEDHRAMFGAREISLVASGDGVPLWIDGDATRISQVVSNLVQNAGKFTNARGRVTVMTERAGGDAILQVSDDGIGIAPELLPGLFQPFRQADQSLHRSAGGLGLGLALVRGLVEMHGGRVEARSAGVGLGAEFTVRLPLLTEANEPAQAQPQESAPPPRFRVLVIDDNHDCADTLREVLELGGHEVEVAYDGLEGVARVDPLRPDVVFCDIGLPGLDGYEVARQIRRVDPEATLIALSGYALPEDRLRALEAGFDHHLGKPLALKELDALLVRLTRRA